MEFNSHLLRATMRSRISSGSRQRSANFWGRLGSLLRSGVVATNSATRPQSEGLPWSRPGMHHCLKSARIPPARPLFDFVGLFLMTVGWSADFSVEKRRYLVKSAGEQRGAVSV